MEFEIENWRATLPQELRDFITEGHKHYLSELSIDCVIFGYHDQDLRILLANYALLDGWGLPGGFIGNNESLKDAATRILKERTSLSNIYLQQYHTFGDNEDRVRSWR